MAANNKAPVIANPELLDRIIGNIQTGLVDNLPWLDKHLDGLKDLLNMREPETLFYPVRLCRANDYIEVTPDANIGNFRFFGLTTRKT